MKSLRLYLIIPLVIILILGVGGCMNILPMNDEAIKDEILAHLSQKYNGQEFEALSLEKGYSITLRCYPKGGDPQADNVRVEKITRDGETIYEDTYFGIIIRDEIESEIISACSGLPLPMKAHFKSNLQSFDNDFDGTKTYADLKQWIANGNSSRFSVTVIVCADDSDKESYSEQIFNKLEKTDFHGMIDVCFYPSEAFEKITRTNRNEIARQYPDQYAIFSKSIN